MSSVDRHLAEKAAADAGWERRPEWHGEWLLCRSARFDIEARVRVIEGGQYELVATSAGIGTLVAEELSLPHADGCLGPLDLSQLAMALRRAAQLARSEPQAPLKEFHQRTAQMPAATEVERIVKQRVGQGIFREAQLDHWGGRCAVTGLDEARLLRASHARPWAKCNSDEQRLDVYNGLLLAPHLDALFDGGWIGFADDGAVVFSQRLTAAVMSALNLSPAMRLRHVMPEHHPYLAYHREQVMGLGAGLA